MLVEILFLKFSGVNPPPPLTLISLVDCFSVTFLFNFSLFLSIFPSYFFLFLRNFSFNFALFFSKFGVCTVIPSGVGIIIGFATRRDAEMAYVKGRMVDNQELDIEWNKTDSVQPSQVMRKWSSVQPSKVIGKVSSVMDIFLVQKLCISMQYVIECSMFNRMQQTACLTITSP